MACKLLRLTLNEIERYPFATRALHFLSRTLHAVISSREKSPVHTGGYLITDGTEETLHRAAKFSFKPNRGQAQRLLSVLRISCEIYNAGLEERKNAWKHQSQSWVNVQDQFTQLTALRSDRSDLFEFGVTPLRGALLRLDDTYGGFFRRCANGQTPGHPRFRSSKRYNTIAWRDITCWKVDLKAGTLYVMGVGTIKLSRSALAQLQCLASRNGVPAALTITRRKAGGGWSWNASVTFKDVTQERTEPTRGYGSTVGLDRGVVVTLATSDGELLVMPNWMDEVREEIKTLQRLQAKKTKRSQTWWALSRKIGRLRKRVVNRTRNWACHTAKDLVAQYDILVLEDLHLQDMTKSARGTIEAPSKDVAQKASLNRGLSEVALGQLTQRIHVKAEEAGRVSWLVNPKNTSRECHQCGHTEKSNRITRDTFYCTQCGHYEHADIQAGTVIKKRGRESQAAWVKAGMPPLKRKKARMQRRRDDKLATSDSTTINISASLGPGWLQGSLLLGGQPNPSFAGQALNQDVADTGGTSATKTAPAGTPRYYIWSDTVRNHGGPCTKVFESSVDLPP